MSTISVKIFAGDDVRRTRIASDAPFAVVQGAVQQAFGTTGSLTWVDEDGDTVSIKTDGDWKEAASAFASVVKLNFAADADADDYPTQLQQQQPQQQLGPEILELAKAPGLTTGVAAEPSPEPANEAAWVEVEDPAVEDPAAAAARPGDKDNEANETNAVDEVRGHANDVAGKTKATNTDTDAATTFTNADATNAANANGTPTAGRDADASETKATNTDTDAATTFTNADATNAANANGTPTAGRDADATTCRPAPEDGDTPKTERSFLAEVFKQVAEQLEAAAEAEAKAPPVHHGVVCDASGEAPITGTRYHLIHYNYDVNEAEFNKLPKEQQALFESIARPGDEPIPVGTTTLPHVRAMFATHKAARLERRRREHEEEAKVTQRPHYAWIPAGDGIAPPCKAAYGSRGPGVAQLQHALIAVGAMHPGAIQWRSGVFGPRTTEAVRTYKAKHGIPSAPYEHGTYSTAVHDALVRDVDALVSGEGRQGDTAAAAEDAAAAAGAKAKAD